MFQLFSVICFQISKRTLEKAIKSEMSGDLKDGMVSVGEEFSQLLWRCERTFTP